MASITITISAQLRDFLRKKGNKGTIRYQLDRKATIKDIIESFGLPHTEVGEIRRFSSSVDFNYIPKEKDVLFIKEIAEPFDVMLPTLLRPEPLSEIRFIADVNVGKLARYLRLIGCDTALLPTAPDKEIARMAETEERILLTKDIGLLKRKNVIFGRYVKSVYPKDQLMEVVRFFNLKAPFHFFSRCLVCNQPTNEIEKEKIMDRLEPKTKMYFNYFKICPECNQIYWKGSHYDNQLAMLKNLGPDIFKMS